VEIFLFPLLFQNHQDKCSYYHELSPPNLCSKLGVILSYFELFTGIYKSEVSVSSLTVHNSDLNAIKPEFHLTLCYAEEFGFIFVNG
jgi:hypothetical protein